MPRFRFNHFYDPRNKCLVSEELSKPISENQAITIKTGRCSLVVILYSIYGIAPFLLCRL